MSGKFESLLDQLGHFGPYQVRSFVLICLPTVVAAMHTLAWVFLGAKPPYRCRLPQETENNASYALPESIINATIPWDNVGQKWSQCTMWEIDLADGYQGGFTSNRSRAVACYNGYVYDNQVYESSTVTEWDMVCDRSWMHATGQAVYMAGVLIGATSLGALADRFGRKPVQYAAILLQIPVSIIAGVVPEYYSFIIMRLITGITTPGVCLVGYVLALEFVGPSKRMIAGTLFHYFYTGAFFIMPLYSYFLNDWRLLQIALGLTGLVFLPYWWLLNESPRWLIANKKTEEARAVILEAAKVNKVDLSPELLDSVLKGNENITEKTAPQEKPRQSLLDLVRFPEMRKKTLNIFFCWMVNSGVYYGLSLNTSNLGGNDYINFMISGAVEIPGYGMVLLIIDRFGRRIPLCGCMFIAGTALVSTILVPEDMHWLTVTLAMLGKMTITASYAIIYIFSAEHFPTVVRNVGMGSASTCARVGGILAPYINLLADTWRPLPLIIFGTLAWTSGALALFLPETLGRQLPDTLEEAERITRGKPIECGPNCSPQNSSLSSQVITTTC